MDEEVGKREEGEKQVRWMRRRKGRKKKKRGSTRR